MSFQKWWKWRGFGFLREKPLVWAVFCCLWRRKQRKIIYMRGEMCSAGKGGKKTVLPLFSSEARDDARGLVAQKVTWFTGKLFKSGQCMRRRMRRLDDRQSGRLDGCKLGFHGGLRRIGRRMKRQHGRLETAAS
ncbi:hypothetical protein Dsin_002161 [Dipteronia sinensis]|uniref:Uncharacterized protein n=1 Tax=Dipteronia sinensis TaxID=43782 RepID=A0AAE0B6L5_9ROSI|nr:hypothetical protein Dsin_002161 [Dipteronia sinensis]